MSEEGRGESVSVTHSARQSVHPISGTSDAAGHGFPFELRAGSALLRYAGWLIAALMTFLAAVSCPAEAMGNLLKNGDFETWNKDGGAPGWPWQVGGATGTAPASEIADVQADTGIVKEGQKSLKITFRGTKETVVITGAAVPVEAGRAYKISCWLRNTGAHFWMRQDLTDKDGRVCAERYKILMDSDSKHDWQQLEGTVKAQEGESSLGLTLFVTGQPGTVWIDDLRIEPVALQAGNEIMFRMMPNYYMDDNIYYLPQGNPMIVMLAAKNEAQVESKNPRYVVELPEGLEMVGGDYESDEFAPPVKIERDGRPYVRYEHAVGVPGSTLPSLNYFDHTQYRSVYILVRTDRSPGAEIYDGWIYYKDDKMTCKASLFRLQIIPRIPVAATPKLFRVSIQTSTSMEFYGKPLALWADFYKEMGFNAINLPRSLRAGAVNIHRNLRNPAPCVKALKAKGISVTLDDWFIKNGYEIYSEKAKFPDDACLRQADGTIVKRAIDPAYARRHGEWFVKAVNDVYDSAIAMGVDNIWLNWEPYIFALEKGSFTDLSMRDFAEFAGLPLEELKAMKPLDIVQKHKEKLMAFQSRQQAEVLKAYTDLAREKKTADGIPFQFISCVPRVTLLPNIEKYRDYKAGFNADDYLPVLGAVSAWFYTWLDCRDYEFPQKKKLVASQIGDLSRMWA